MGTPIVGISLKMYFTLARTRAWLGDVAAAANEDAWPAHLEVFVLPDFLSIEAAGALLAGSGVSYGAQDVFWEASGAYTGEISAATLAEAGCRYVEVGHAERRRLFGEDDRITARKAAAATAHGLTAVVCIGETARTSPEAAAAACLEQVLPVLEAVSDDAPLTFAYEPIWAIGQASPAEPGHIVDVAGYLRDARSGRPGPTSLIYGGSAGRGLFSSLWPALDGLFLGRFAHDVNDLRAIVSEVVAVAGAQAPSSA